MKKSPINVNITISYESIAGAIASLELKQMLELKQLLEDKIQESLVKDQGESEELSKEIIREDFQQAWHEAMTGQTIPIEQLWEELNDVK
jgi:hypothetical protein